MTVDPTHDLELLAAVGPRVRTSPFFDATLRAGLTTVVTFNHMLLPVGYGDPEAEYRRLTEAVSLWDVAAQRHLAVTGSEADQLVRFVTAVDTDRVAPGHGTYAPMVDHDGVVINDPVVFHWPDGSWRFSIADADVGLWLHAVATGEGYDAAVRELDTATLAVQGPRALDVMDALDLPWARNLERFEQRPAVVDGIDVVVSNTGWSSQGGVELFLDDPSQAEPLWDTVAEGGEPYGIGPGGPNAQERLEHVLLSYGTDTGYHRADAIELGLEGHLDLDGPPFIGQPALRRIRDEGPRRRLRGVVIDGTRIGALARPVPFRVGDGEGGADIGEVGQVRSADWSPRFRRNLGLALVYADCEPGTRGVVVLPAGFRPAELVSIPFTESLSGSGAAGDRGPDHAPTGRGGRSEDRAS